MTRSDKVQVFDFEVSFYPYYLSVWCSFFFYEKTQGKKPKTKNELQQREQNNSKENKQQQLHTTILQENMLHKAWAHTFPNLCNT